MKNFGFIVMLAMFAMLESGCARTNVAPPQDQSPTQSGTTLDDKLMRIAGQIPGFGGMFFDENGVLNVYMKAVEEPPNATALREVQGQVVTAITEVMGQNFFEQAQGPRGDPAQKALPKQAEAIKILKGEFDVLQLAAWRKSLDEVLSLPGVVFTDLDEQHNRLKVGIEASTARESIEAQVNNLGIPQEALLIEVAKPIRFQATLRDKHRPVRGGVQIEADVGVFASKTCTLGFNAVRSGRNGFVTNSHCTETRGSSDNNDFHQPDDPLFGGNKIGDENADPPFFTGGACPAGRRCRFSDSAFIDYTIARGRDIARTTNDHGSITIDNAHSTIRIVSETAEPVAGIVLNKMGRTTGWAFGRVVGTCETTRVADTDITMLCQGRVMRFTGDNRLTDNGDSGSPVFGLLPNEQEASLYGILWGGPDDGSSFVFSSMGLIEAELGPLTTVFPPSTTPPGCPAGQRCCEPEGDGCALCWPINQECP